jgi:selenocysteine lyase/cysteine desulfurase
MGIPPASARLALADDLERWAHGGATTARYDSAVERARAAYASLVHVERSRVAIGSQVSVQASVIASSVPDGADVLCPRGDFSSVAAPFAQHAHRGVTLREVPLEALADAITDATWLVAFSLVQSASGAIADADAVLEAARRHGARTLVDLTQAAGWLDFDAGRADVTVAHAYKWLCAPRGASLMTIDPTFQGELRAVQAGWYAGEQIWDSCYGSEITLASDARRFDVSPVWSSWIGAAESLELFTGIEPGAVHAHDVGLAAELAAALGVPARGSAIVTWADADGRALRALTDAGVAASGRAGNARVAFHLWNDERDVARVVDAVR